MSESMRTKELANHMKVSTETVRRWYHEGKIPGRRLSAKVILFDPVAVVAALEAATRVVGQQAG